MDARDVLIDGIERSCEVCHGLLDGLTADQVNWRPGGDHNSIGWLVWHIAREQDVQIAALAGSEQAWTAKGWVDRFALDLPAGSMGYGHTAEEAGRVVVHDPCLLSGYLDDAVDATIRYLKSLDEGSLQDVVDQRWDPPVTRGVRLVSVVDDASQHAGQAAYVRGLLP
ncbi:mycothiol transferase [Cumulibacter manganitolerans]|uniref:mycothiol transferase n=1 Tax=Cumulibacter manganitolerans TaxID=1884992 RepID=UPI0012980F13|nr:DinB family protein [Cumulibacter manganitolerans]